MQAAQNAQSFRGRFTRHAPDVLNGMGGKFGFSKDRGTLPVVVPGGWETIQGKSGFVFIRNRLPSPVQFTSVTVLGSALF